MDAEILAFGDELTSGQRLDTNSQWLSQRLAELGIRVLFHTTAADDLAASVTAIRQALARADVIISTGGLGPTADDLTRQALADAAGRGLYRDEEALAQIRRMFARRQRPMPERNAFQAMFPEGSRPLPNPHGTAPGIELELARAGRPAALFFALPGVPAEMREIWEQSVAPALRRLAADRPRVIRHRQINCFGVGESDLEQMLPDLIRRGRHPTVGITVHQATITLRVTAEGASEAECRAAIEPTVATIRSCLGDLVFGEEDEQLQDAVARRLDERRQRLATAEGGTCGLLALWMAGVGSGGAYAGGVVLPRLNPSGGVLGIPRELAERHGPVSSELATALAQQVRQRYRATYGLAVTPFPPEPYEVEQGAAAQCFVALDGPGVTTARPFSLAGHPAIVRERSAKQALNLLRLYLRQTD